MKIFSMLLSFAFSFSVLANTHGEVTVTHNPEDPSSTVWIKGEPAKSLFNAMKFTKEKKTDLMTVKINKSVSCSKATEKGIEEGLPEYSCDFSFKENGSVIRPVFF